MPDPRLERVLTATARRYAPALLPASPAGAGMDAAACARLAAGLARANVLVLPGTLQGEHGAASGVYYTDWVSLYAGLYTRLCEVLFPSFCEVSAYYADDAMPPIVLIHGAVMPVIDVMARYTAPFVAAAQAAALPIPDDALLGLAAQMLAALEAGDLQRMEYRRLQAECAMIMRQMIVCNVRQHSLTPPAPDLHLPQAAQPAPPPSLPEAPPAPPSLPEEAHAPSPAGVPVFFDSRRASAAGALRRPPVPDLPE